MFVLFIVWRYSIQKCSCVFFFSWLEDSDDLGMVEVELYMDRMENVPNPASNDVHEDKGDNSDGGAKPEDEEKKGE